MIINDLRDRYLAIAKQKFPFLKERGYQKKGMKYIKQNADLFFTISISPSRPWINSDSLYEFTVSWEITTNNPKYIELYKYMENEKKTKISPIIWSNVISKNHDRGIYFLKMDDPSDSDQEIIDQIRNGLEQLVVPLLDEIHSIDDIISIAEEEYKIQKEKRIFFPNTNIRGELINFYIFKGWRDKAIDLFEEYVESTPATARDLAEKRKKKYIKFMDQSQ